MASRFGLGKKKQAAVKPTDEIGEESAEVPPGGAANEKSRMVSNGAPSTSTFADAPGIRSPVRSPTPKGGTPVVSPVTVGSPPQVAVNSPPVPTPKVNSLPAAAAAPKPVATPSLPAPSAVAAPAKPKHGLAEDFTLTMPATALQVLPESAAPIDVALVPVARNAGVACTTLRSLLGRAITAVRLVLALPVGISLLVGVVLLVLLVLLQLTWLLPLAVLLGLLLPGEAQARTLPMALPAQHVVVLGGGAGLTRAVALECVRRGADVTVLAAESDALTQTYELMKTTSLDRQAHVKQQLRCSPLELSDGPMACFVALQNVLELVGKIDCFICHPAELILEGKGTLLPPGSLFADGPQSRLTAHDITESVLCCVWAVRAIMFPMQMQANGRVMVLGSAPSNALHSERIAFKLAMQSLGRSLRSELGEFCIPVCLAAPIGSEEPLPSAEPTAVPPPSPPSGLMGSLTGLGRAKPTLSEYARHVVSGMLEGAPYILAPGGDGILSSKAVGGGRCCFGGIFGYGNLTPAIMVLHALTMPMLSLLDTGMPILWREVAARWWHGNTLKRMAKSDGRYTALRDDPLAA